MDSQAVRRGPFDSHHAEQYSDYSASKDVGVDLDEYLEFHGR